MAGLAAEISSAPVIQLTPDLTVSQALQLLSKLEQAPALIVAHWETLEQLIAACMERTFQASEDR